MAIRMRAWISIVLVSCVALVVSTPPRAAVREVESLDPGRSRYGEVVAEVGATHLALQATRWVDSLSALAVRDAVDGLAIGLPPEGTSPEFDARWDVQLRGRVAQLGPRDESVVIGIYRQRLGHGAHPGVRNLGLMTATFAGTRDGVSYCLRVFRDGAPPRNPDLGVCRYFARYGPAGPSVSDWLRAGNAGHARVGGNVNPARLARTERDPVFGINRTLAVGAYAPPSAAHCIAGRAEECAASVSGFGSWLAAEQPQRAFELVYAPPSWFLDWGVGVPVGNFLSELEREFGREAFARFWRSPNPLPEAFEAAFGLGIGDWVLGKVEVEYGVERAGPGLTPGTMALTLLAMGALASAATLVQTYRRIA